MDIELEEQKRANQRKKSKPKVVKSIVARLAGVENIIIKSGKLEKRVGEKANKNMNRKGFAKSSNSSMLKNPEPIVASEA